MCLSTLPGRYMLYRDYETFLPIVHERERESYISYFDLYKEFYRSPFFNSVDFRNLYQTLLKYVPIVEFLDDEGNITNFPVLVDTKMNTPVRYKRPMSNKYNFSNDPSLLSIIFISNDEINQDVLRYKNIGYFSTNYRDGTQTLLIPVTIENGILEFTRINNPKNIIDKYQR